MSVIFHSGLAAGPAQHAPRKGPVRPSQPAARARQVPGNRPPGGPPAKKAAPVSRRAPAKTKPVKKAKPARKGGVSPPMIVFLLAFLVILGLTVRFILVGIRPFDETAAELFPLDVFDTVLVLSFLVWPVVSFLGVKMKKKGLVWTGAVAFLFVSSIFVFMLGPSPLGVQHMLFAGPLMLIGALWHSSRS